MAVFVGSRYARTGLYRTDEHLTLVFDIRSRPKFNPDNFLYYTWVQGDTADGVAYRYYKNAQLWWAIMDANPQYMFDNEINPGDIVNIPGYLEVARLSG